MPVVLAISLRPDGNTGVHTHLRQLRMFLDEQGVPHTEVTPFSWGGAARYPVFGLRRLVLDRFSQSAGILWYRFSHERFLRRALAKHLADLGTCVVYAQDPLAAQAALSARRGTDQRVVMAVHFRISQADEAADGGGISRGGRAFRAIRRTERNVIPRVDGLVYVSKWGKDALLGWLPEAATVGSTVVANFVEPCPSSERPGSAGDLVTTGRLEPAKNQRFLLHVLNEAKRAGHYLTLDLFGEGPSHEELLAESRALGLEEQVRFHGFCPDVRSRLPGYKVYVHASKSESLPLSVIEAMAAGLPVVAGNTGGIAELCDDGVEGRFWPLDDPAKAADVLTRLVASESLRTQTGNAARARFRRDFDTNVVAPQLLSFLTCERLRG